MAHLIDNSKKVIMKKEKQIVVRMDEEMHTELKELAEKDCRYLSDFVRLHLKKLIEANKKMT